MKKTFTVKKGKHYFKGIKFQELFYPLITLALAIILYFVSTIDILFSWISLGVSVFFYVLVAIKLSNLEIQARFRENCLYLLESNFEQINKLYGLSEGWHHKNSARFGWRVKGHKIEILAYTYMNGKRDSKPLMICEINEWVKLELHLLRDKYVFVGENEDGEKAKVSMPRKTGFRFGKLFIYKLFPYFGGSVPAPHDMSIDIVEKEK